MTFQAIYATAERSSICLESEYPLSEASNKRQPQEAKVFLVSLTKWEVPHLADFGKLSHSSDEANAEDERRILLTILGRNKRFFSSPKSIDLFQDLHILLLNGF
jgi:hypothetical protein